MRAFKITLLLFLVLIIGIFGIFLGLYLSDTTLEESELPIPFINTPTPPPPVLEPLPQLALSPVWPREEQLDQFYAACWSYEKDGPCVSDGETASQDMTVRLLDLDALAGAGMRQELQERLKERVEAAARPDEIYLEDRRFRPELLEQVYEELLGERLSHPEDWIRQERVRLRYVYTESGWELRNGEDLYPGLPDVGALYSAATQDLPYIPLHYRIAEEALCAPAPVEDRFLVTDDPAEILALLETPEARALIGEEQLVWNADIPFIAGRPIRCYLDETILCIVWQEPEAQAVGTFTEVFIADGSQFRRKISSDEPWSLWFETTTSFSRKANAVVALGGDFYYHGRDCGVSVYQRQIIRFRPDNADTCFITADGDLLFRYMGDDTGREDTEQFLRDNDVLFSLAFGPVLIDDGVDVTPETYIWGEVRDYYARSALGLLGRHHYLCMNINCDPRVPALDHLPNLRDAANAMVRRGCWKAYTLDGGQTASTAFHFQLINPVQYGREKPISDIIYFASALPEDQGRETADPTS
ncbi:MAG: phosphodiester glycosidase family protein [Oscillospiraceae bacterium]|nr:phosphodiester glycosidase family protein [Oscillospiraceae bacterium]